MALADIADVERIETDEWLDSRCLILSEITMIKIRAQWAGKVKYQICTLINQVDYPPLSSFCYRSSSERRKPSDVT